MYQSLYRKYRPQSFEEVVGQSVIVRTLENSIKNNKLSHAYLFTGPRGTGKTSIAKILAKTINCENLNGFMPCNNCNCCKQINNKQSIDIIEIDAASNNGVDEIREINNKINLVPSIGKYKVYIIDEVHMLTTGAFNALLKTLEEPPSHIIFILATTEPHKIPATILSRCQRFDFKKINKEEIISRIKNIVKKEKITIEDEAINEIAILSDGGMRDALSILDQVIAYADEKITIQDIHEINGTITKIERDKFLLNIINNNINDVFNDIDKFDLKGKDFIKLTEELIVFLRDILINKVVNNDNYNYEIENIITVDQIIEIIKKFNSILLEMKNSNYPKIIFEMQIIQLLNFKQNKVNDNMDKIKLENNKIKEKFDSDIVKSNIDLNNLKNIRINNTLCSLDKNTAIELKNKINDISNSLILDEYAIYYSLILEGKLTAYGNNTIIFVFENQRLSDEFNQNYDNIENMLEKYLNEKYKVISTYQEDWLKIKNNYAKNKNSYKYIEEPIIKKTVDNDSIETVFENIIEYS